MRSLSCTSASSTTLVAANDNRYFRLVRDNAKPASSATTLFPFDQSGHLLEEWNTATGPQADYLYLGDVPLATLTPSTAALNYLNDDTLGTPQLATSSTQATSWKTTYQPFGKTAAITGSLIQNLRLPGQYADAETGFNHNGFRDYMPNWGRYLEVDPIGLQGGINTYGYVGQNPGKWTDITGLLNLNLLPTYPTGGGQPTIDQINQTINQQEMSNFYNPPGYSVAAHGSPTSISGPSGQDLTPSELANEISADPSYSPGEPVTLYSCSTGQGDNSFAQQLANVLNASVTAPDDVLVESLD